MGPLLGLSFLILAVILTLSIALLILRLRVKQKLIQENGVPNVFGKEIWNLVIILAVFTTSFLIRYIFDEWFLSKILKAGSFFVHCMELLVMQYFWDFIPVGAICLFHRHNFSVKNKNSNDDQLETEP